MAHSASRLARALLAVEVVRSALRDSHGSTIVPGRIGPDTSAVVARRAFTFSVAYGNEVAQQTAGLVDTVRRGSRVETYPRFQMEAVPLLLATSTVSLNEADPAALVERNRVAVEHVVNAINRATAPASEEAATNGKGTRPAASFDGAGDYYSQSSPWPEPHEAKGTAQPVESSETNQAVAPLWMALGVPQPLLEVRLARMSAPTGNSAWTGRVAALSPCV
jgi:hypothetical protein